MRKRCLNMVYELAKKDDKVIFVGSDLSPGLLAEMQRDYPHRFYMEGIVEAQVVGMAAGLALEGFKPYVNTIATFLTRRCFEQVAIDLCLHNLPVRLIGNGGGYVYAPLGPTHQAIEDIAIMRALPNMTVTAVCDADEMERLMQATLDWAGPVYIRMGKGGDPVISSSARGFEIGKGIDMIDNGTTKSDVVIFSTGVVTAAAVEAAEQLKEKGMAVRVIHLHTIKPLDEDLVIRAVCEAGKVITVEEHSLIGGLGSAIVECLIDAEVDKLPPIKRLGIPDCYAEHYGSQKSLLDHDGINKQGIINAVG